MMKLRVRIVRFPAYDNLWGVVADWYEWNMKHMGLEWPPFGQIPLIPNQWAFETQEKAWAFWYDWAERHLPA